MKNFVYLTAFSIVLSIFCSCGDSNPINTKHNESFTKNGKLKEYPVFIASMPTTLKVYIEASGSMSGFFRRNVPNAFKRDTWSVLSSAQLGVDTIFLFTGGNQPSRLRKDSFKEQMNQGNLTSANSTDILSMIRTMIKTLDTGGNDCAVLVSDMKYSPKGNLQMALSQYETDVRNLVEGKLYAYSLIGVVSDFVGNNGNVLCEESPYYYFVVGKSEQVVWMRNEIIRLIGKSVVGVVEYGVDYKTPTHSALDNKGVFNCLAMPKVCNKSGFHLFKSYSSKGEFIVAVDFSHLSFAITEQDVVAKTTYGSTVLCQKIEIDWNSLSVGDKGRSTSTSTFYKITLPNVRSDMEVVEIQFSPKSKQNSLERFFCATSEGDNTKSFSIENLMKGLKSGSKSFPFQQEPLRILISKQK